MVISNTPPDAPLVLDPVPSVDLETVDFTSYKLPPDGPAGTPPDVPIGMPPSTPPINMNFEPPDKSTAIRGQASVRGLGTAEIRAARPSDSDEQIILPGYAQNWGRELTETKAGIAALMASTLKTAYHAGEAMAMHPADIIESIRHGKIPEGSLLRDSRFAGDIRILRAAIPQMGEQFVDDIIRTLKQPGHELYVNPLSTLLNLQVGLQGAGAVVRGGLRLAGEGARLAGRETMVTGIRDVLAGSPSMVPAGRASIQQTLSKNPILQMAQQALIKTSQKVPGVSDILSIPGMRGIMPPGAISEDARMALMTGRDLHSTNIREIAKSNKVIENIQKTVGSLKEGERDAFVAVVEGRAVPYKMSKKFQEAYDFHKTRTLSDAQQFNLPDEVTRTRAYEPLVMSTKGAYDEPLAVKIDLMGEAKRGNMAAMRKVYENAKRGDTASQNMVKGWNREIEISRIKQAEEGVREFLSNKKAMSEDFRVAFRRPNGDIIKGTRGEQHFQTAERARKGVTGAESGFWNVMTKRFYTTKEATGYMGRMSAPTMLSDVEIKAMAKDLARELTPTPIYFPHLFEGKLKISDFIRVPTGLQRYKPGFLKISTGKSGYIETNPAYALITHEKQVQRFKATEGMINGIIEKFAEPLKNANDLRPGYKVFAPEGSFKFYRTYLDFQDAFSKGLALHKDLDQAYIDAAKTIMQSEVPKDRFVVGVRRAPMYQVPKAVADKLMDELKTTGWPASMNPAMKILYDKPLDAFRYSVLGFRPGWVLNNVAGNVVTSLLSRVNLPVELIRAQMPRYREALGETMGELRASGFRRSEQRMMGVSRLQKTNPIEHMASMTGQILFSNEPVMESKAAEVTRKLLTFPLRAAKGFASGIFEANSRVEDAFREAVAVKAGRKQAIEVLSIDRTSPALQDSVRVTKQASRSFFDAKHAWDKFVGAGDFTESKILAKMKKLSAKPEMRQEVLDSVYRALNDYSALNSFERGVVRRVVPFWTWWKFINTFAVRTAFQDPLMADLGRYMSVLGNDIETKEWEKNGLHPDEIPLWKRGSTILSREGNKFKLLFGGRLNPLDSVGPGGISISPLLQTLYEMKTGKNFETGRPFSDPSTREVYGKTFERTGKRTVRQAETGPTPDFVSEMIRNAFPPVAEVERLMHPWKFYDTDPLFGKHRPVPDFRGKPTEHAAAERLARLMGISVSDFEKISAIKGRVAQINAIRSFLRQDVLRKRAQRIVDVQ